MNLLAPPPPVVEDEDCARRPERVGSFGKGLMVIKALAAARQGMTLSEVAEATGTTRASARRYLLTLIALGYAENIQKRFELTPLVMELSGPRFDTGLTWQIARPRMEKLVREIGESCTAAIRDVDEVVCTAHVEADRRLAFRLPVGARLPLITTALGRAILSDISDDCVREVVALAPPARHTHFSITDPELLVEEVRKVRETGYSIVDQELELGLRSIAVPVRNARGRVFAALNISTDSARVELRAMVEDYLAPLTEAASAISRLNRTA